MFIPKFFNCPIWFGKVKNRIAKKHIHYGMRKFIHFNKIHRSYYDKISNLDVGDIVHNCSGMNGRILEINPIYRNISKGFYLKDISFTFENTNCSMLHCSIEPAYSREVIENNFILYMENWFFKEQGKIYYGGLDNQIYRKEIELYKKKYETIKSGGHIVDENGICLLEFKS